MVKSLGEEAICFDADAAAGETILLFFDMVTGFSVSGVIAHREKLDRTVIGSMTIMTPNGVTLQITHNSLKIAKYESVELQPQEIRNELVENGESMVVGDIEIKALHRERGLQAIRFSV